MNLKEKLIEYKNITIQLIANVEGEDYDSLEKLLTNRQNIMNEIDSITYSKEEFLVLCKELDILVLNQKLIKVTKEKKSNTLKNIDGIKVSKTANKSYNKRFAVDSVYFNKKI
ncbi:flagellar protein FliT [Clostridium sp. CX1]|uniref:flagellar protein FliT n=1 Tax=Clostridium sp. CX1 TaxID=2978346 RepID=UPI0021C1EBEA|nr:flagellar protein FliT [Clostridium sp. CX1]MCT8976133.1 flagellar protein FliT [Clostridium sp. CX1]